MLPRRSLTVLVAVIVGGLASASAYIAVHSAQQKAYKNATLTSVYVLKGVVPRDESAAAAYAQGLIKSARMPLQFVPPGAVTDLSVIRDQAAESNLPAGEVVVTGMFVSPDAIPSVASETVPKGDVAISVSVDQVHGVAGLIQPGDKVDILVDIGGDQETYLYQSVPVMAVGTTLVPVAGKRSTAGQTSADAQPSNIITFAVPPAAATRIALANSGGGGVTGGIYLALAAPGNGPTSTTPVTGSNLIDGASTGAPTPAGGSSPSASGLATGERIQGSEKNDTTP